MGCDPEGPLCELLFFFLSAIFQALAEEQEEVAKDQVVETDTKGQSGRGNNLFIIEITQAVLFRVVKNVFYHMKSNRQIYFIDFKVEIKSHCILNIWGKNYVRSNYTGYSIRLVQCQYLKCQIAAN